MASREDLKEILERIDEKGYKAYKDIEGSYDFGIFVLYVDHVQGDPFAAPSRIRVQIPLAKAGFPSFLYEPRTRRIALQDFITRRFDGVMKKVSKGHRGTGKSGLISID